MSDPDEVTCVHPADRRTADPTQGKVREQAIDVHGLWSGLVRNDPGAASGWQHHGDHDTSVYVVAGTVRIEFGPGGAQAVDAGRGDFLHICPTRRAPRDQFRIDPFTRGRHPFRHRAADHQRRRASSRLCMTMRSAPRTAGP
jgi:hypothetical protein